MIDINELRRRIDWGCKVANGVVSELLDQLEAAEKERDDVAQQLVQSEIGKREISEAHNAVTGRLSDLADENTALRAKIAEMEQQEPVAWVVPPSSRPHWGEHAMQDAAWEARQCGGTAKAEPLYALPGAKGEGK